MSLLFKFKNFTSHKRAKYTFITSRYLQGWGYLSRHPRVTSEDCTYFVPLKCWLKSTGLLCITLFVHIKLQMFVFLLIFMEYSQASCILKNI